MVKSVELPHSLEKRQAGPCICTQEGACTTRGYQSTARFFPQKWLLIQLYWQQSLLFAQTVKRQMAPIRIAIIDCDPLIESIRKSYGDYGGVIRAFLHAGAEHIGLPFDELHLTVWSVKERQEYPALEEVDCILISGSSMY